MNSSAIRIIVIILIIIGEVLSIYAEMIAAKSYFQGKPLLNVFFIMFLLITLAGAFLILGYMLGFSSFKNIWIISVVSITSIIVVEPILAYTFFHQLPTKGALIGLILGVLGFLSAVLID